MSVASLTVIFDRHYRISIGIFWLKISFLETSQQSSSFLNLVEVTLNGLCPIFHRTDFLSSENLAVFVSYSKKQFFFFFDQSLYLESGLITCAGHTTRRRQSCVSTLITHSSRPIKTRALRCSLYNLPTTNSTHI